MNTHLFLKSLLAASLGLGVSVACLAETCEALKDQIDAKIRAGGVQNFSLRIVDAAESTGGRTVGTCGMGQKKIVYSVGAGGVGPSAAPVVAASGAASAPSARRRNPVIITECKDGSPGPVCGKKSP